MIPTPNQNLIKQGIELILAGLGEEVDSPQFKDTPERVAKMYSDVMDGAFTSLDDAKLTKFDGVAYDGMIMVHNIPFYALCAHHLLMFQGTVGLAYVPKKGGPVLGLSKLVRIFRHECKRPTTQEEITSRAVRNLMDYAEAKSAICHVRAEHTCMTLRGVKSPGSLTTTIASEGEDLKDGTELRRSFMMEVTR